MKVPTMHLRTPQSTSLRRGVGTLAVTLILLFVTSIGVLYVNRGVLFEQRTSANQAQATLAHEVAEAGLEWATGMLNTPTDIGPDCAFLTTTNVSFRKKYVTTNYNAVPPSSDVAPAANTFPGCKIDPASGATTCSCPAAGAAASLGSSVQPSFTVAFEAVAGSVDAVKVTSYACTAQAANCLPTNFSDADGNARLSVTLKLRPLLRAVPAGPLTCGTSCTLGGSFNITNTDAPTNGILVNAGSTIATNGGTTATTIPGQPAQNAMIGNDASLSALSSADPTCSNSAMFKTYFGSTMAQYRDSSSTKRLSCGSASDCEAKLNAAYNDGWRAFYFDSDFQLSGNHTYGTQADPISLVTPNALSISGTNDFYGLIFSNNSDWNSIGTGTSRIHGAEVTCAAYNSNGDGSITYDPVALANLRGGTGVMVRVPGSWRDFRTNADTLP